jgi:hypothetical protein
MSLWLDMGEAYNVLLLPPFRNSENLLATMMVNLMYNEGKSKM